MPEVRYQFVAADAGSVITAFRSIGEAAHSSSRDLEKTRVDGQGAMRAVAQEATRAGRTVQSNLYPAFDKVEKVVEKLVGAIHKLSQGIKQIPKMPVPTQPRRPRGGGNMSFASSFARSAGRRILYSAGAKAMDIGTRAIRENIALEDQAARIATKGRKVGEAGESPRDIARELQRTAVEVPGSKASDIGSAIEAFIAKTGEGKVGRTFQKGFAQLSLAEGVKGEDLGSAAADIYKKAGVHSPEEMQSVLERLSMQGKSGSFEMTDMAKRVPKMASAAARASANFTGENIVQLGGVAQLATEATGGGASAATAVEGMFTQLIKKAGKGKGKIGSYGVDVFESKNGIKQMRDFTDVLPELIKATKGDAQKLQGIFDKKAYSAVSGLVKIFQKVVTEGGTLDDGFKAVRDALKQTVDAGTAHAEVMKDLATMQETTGAKLDAAWESIKAQLADDAGPAIIDAIKTIADELKDADFKPLFRGLAKVAEYAIGAAEALGLIAHKDVTTAEAEVYKDSQTKLGALSEERKKLMDKVGTFSATPAERERLDAIDKETAELNTKSRGSKQFAEIDSTRKEFEALATGLMNSGQGGALDTRSPATNASMIWDEIQSGKLNKPGATVDQEDIGIPSESLQKLIDAFNERMNPGKMGVGANGAEIMNDPAAKLSQAAAALQSAADKLDEKTTQQSVFSGFGF